MLDVLLNVVVSILAVGTIIFALLLLDEAWLGCRVRNFLSGVWWGLAEAVMEALHWLEMAVVGGLEYFCNRKEKKERENFAAGYNYVLSAYSLGTSLEKLGGECHGMNSQFDKGMRQAIFDIDDSDESGEEQ